MSELPILDHHMHLDPVAGEGAAAADRFAAAGGTHLFVLNKPSWALSDRTGEAAFRETFRLTEEVAAAASARLPGRAWPVLGVHPALISRLRGRGFEPAEAAAFMKTGLDIAASFVAEGPAVALKSGRPHYEVSDAVWAASNEVLRHALSLGATHDCPVQLHTEGGSAFPRVTGWACDRGLAPERVVVHYADGPVDDLTPSVISHKDGLQAAVADDQPFLMETDYLDDPDRPGAVLGVRTVPRRVRWLREHGHDDAVRRAHVETPARVYGVDTEATLGGTARNA